MGWALIALAGCAVVPDRPAVSSYECMKAVRDALPAGLDNKRAHCLAAGGIAQRCSVFEADLAGLGKEVRDVFTGGDASWADWRADRTGIRCVKLGKTAEALATCCQEAGDWGRSGEGWQSAHSGRSRLTAFVNQCGVLI